MQQLRVKEKDRTRVVISDELQTALKEAWEIIQESKRDREIRIDYSSAIQVPPWLVGGCIGSEKRPFEFTYYLRGDRATRWQLTFHPLEIEDIADGHTTELILYCCRTPGCGYKSNDPISHCGCDYENDPYFGHNAPRDTAEALTRRGVAGLSESSAKADILEVLGQPGVSGGGCDESGNIPHWIKYFRSDCQLHFQFDSSEKLEKLTIMEADWKPGT